MRAVVVLTDERTDRAASGVSGASGVSHEHPGGWWSHRVRAMGTRVDVVAHAAPVDAPSRVDDLLERCEASWSRFRPESDLSALNRSPRSCNAVSPLLEHALHRATAAWSATSGRFDPTVLDAVEHAGYDRDFRALDRRPQPVPTGRRVPGLSGVHLERGHVVRPVGLRFDLGGIGKGLAADLLTAELLARGADSVCVSVGGDVRVAGMAPTGGWRVPVDDAHRQGVAMVAVLDGGALATSSTRVRRWPSEDGGWIHHLVDPVTGRPADSGVTCVTVAAAEAWWAEVLAKAALVAGPIHGADLVRDAGASGWLGTDDGQVIEVGGPGDPP
jgi:thiamine biosynthesis lipoprotein